MKVSRKSFFCITAVAMLASGCQSQTSPPPAEASAQAGIDRDDHADNAHADDVESDVTIAMKELSPEDRKEAESQKYCAVSVTSRLGSMGAPLKLDVNGQPVFVCCAGCKSTAMKNADKTLATVARLKAENSSRE